MISALVKKDLSKDTEIKLSFSQPDTFNEKYEDVAFNCKNIIISAEKIETATVETHQNEESTTKAPSPIDSSQVLDAVKITLEQSGYKSLSDVTNKEKFVREFNKNLEIITGSNEHNVSNFESLVSLYNSAYEGKFITDATNSIEQNDIQTAINEALKSVNASSLDEIKDKDKEKFVKKIEEKLKEQNPDTPNISEELETDKALDIIKKLYNSTNSAQKEDNNDTQNNSNIIIVISIATIVVVLLTVLTILLKKKKQNNTP